MKIELIVEQDGNDLDKHTLLIDDKEVAFIQDLFDCPEDAHIGRDLIDGNDIIKFIQMGYNAAKLGETLEINTIKA